LKNWSEIKAWALKYKIQLTVAGGLLLLVTAGIISWSYKDRAPLSELNTVFNNTRQLSSEVADLVAGNVYRLTGEQAGNLSTKARDLSLSTGQTIGSLGILYKEIAEAEVNPEKQTAKARELISGKLPVELEQQLKQAGLAEPEIRILKDTLAEKHWSASRSALQDTFQQANLSLYRLQVASSFLYLQAMANKQEMAGKKPVPLDVATATMILTSTNEVVNQLEQPEFQWPSIRDKARILRGLAEKHLDSSPFNKHLGTLAIASLELENAAVAAQNGNEPFALLQAAHWKSVLKEITKENKLAIRNLRTVAQAGATDVTGTVVQSLTDDYLEKISLTITSVPQIKSLSRKVKDKNPLFAKEAAELKKVLAVTDEVAELFIPETEPEPAPNPATSGQAPTTTPRKPQNQADSQPGNSQSVPGTNTIPAGSPDGIAANIRVYTSVYTDVYKVEVLAVKNQDIAPLAGGAFSIRMNMDTTKKYRLKLQKPLYQVVYYPKDTAATLVPGRNKLPEIPMSRLNGYFLTQVLTDQNLKPLNEAGERQLLAGLTDNNGQLSASGASVVILGYTLQSSRSKIENAFNDKDIYDAGTPVLDEDELINGLKTALTGYLKYSHQPNLKTAQQLLDNSVTGALKTALSPLTKESLTSAQDTIIGEVYVDNYHFYTMNFTKAKLLVFYSYNVSQFNGATGVWEAPTNSGQYYKVISLEKVNNKWLISDIKSYEPKPEEFKKEPQQLTYIQDPDSSIMTLKLKVADLDNLREILEGTLKTKHPAMSGIRMDAGYDQRVVELDKDRLLVVKDYVGVLDKTFKNIATYKITARKYGPFWKLDSFSPGAPPLNDFLARSLFFDFFTSVKTTKDYNTALEYTTGEANTRVKKFRSGALKATSDPIFRLDDLDANSLVRESAKGKLYTYKIVTQKTPGSPMLFHIVFEQVGDKYLIRSWTKVNLPPTEPLENAPPIATPTTPGPDTQPTT